jgi:predicted enzyme related to lactoylglutathione lyase
LGWIVVDCADPERLARFWAALLDGAVEERIGTSPMGPRYVVLHPHGDANVALTFQWVPESKRSKNRLHLDVVAVQGLDAVTRIVEELGGSRRPEGDFSEQGWAWRVMTDPEDNEFCLILNVSGPPG